MTELHNDAVLLEGDDVTIEAEVLAPCLDLSVETLRQAMNAGEIRTLVERGEDEDEGRMRLTFRHGHRQVSIMREPDGNLHWTDPPPLDRRPVRPSIMQLFDPGHNDA